MRQKIICWLVCVFVALGTAGSLRAQGTAFNYQGQLSSGGNPANGSYDLAFSLFSSTNLAASIVAGPITNSAVAVTNGLFTTTLDFGAGIFSGINYWLEIAVRTNGAVGFTKLAPRQPLLPVPYAIFAGTASNLLGSLATTQLNGTLPSAQINGMYSSAVNFNNLANHFAGSFGGDGSSLSNLDASRLASGTVADTRLSANVALLNTNQTFTGSNTFTGFNTFTGTNTLTGVNTFTNFGNSFRGSFFGNGLVGWISTIGTAVQAVIDTGYVLTSPQLVTVTLPASPSVGDIVRISGAGTGGWKLGQNPGQSVIGSFSGYAGSYWTAGSSINNVWESIASSSDGIKLAAAAGNAGIYTSANSGLLWTKAASYPAAGADGVATSANGGRLVAVFNNGGLGGGVFTSTNSGSTWQNTGLGNGNWFSVASSADGSHLVAVVNGGNIYVSTSFGQSGTWSAQATARNWYSVASSANGTNLVAVVKGGGIYTNSGTSWVATSATSGLNWVGVASSADGSKLAAVVLGGGIYTSSNFGSTWTQQTNAPNGNWLSIASSADGGKLAAAVYGGNIYFSSNFGVTWTLQFNAPVAFWQGIASSADGTKLAAAINNTSAAAPPVGIYVSQASTQISSLTGTNGFVSGGQGTAVELQYIGSGQFMPVSSAGTIWAN